MVSKINCRTMLSIPYHSKSKYEKFGYNDELEKRTELLGKLSSQQLSDRPGMTHVLHYFFFHSLSFHTNHFI